MNRDVPEALKSLFASMNSALCAALPLIERFDRERLYELFGCESTAKWLTSRCEVAPETAREHVRVARALRALPLIRDAVTAGRISYTKARAVTRIATEEDEAQWLTLAGRLPAKELEQRVREERDSRTVEDPERQANERMLQSRTTDSGMLEVRALLPAVEGAIFAQAIRAAGRLVDVSAETDDYTGSSIPDRRRADALLAICKAYLAGGSTKGAGEQYAVLVHLDPATGIAKLDDGPRLAPESLERIMCDAAVRAIKRTESRRVVVGHSVDSVPPAMRRAILGRDVCCQYPGCSNDQFLHIHHVKRRGQKGKTTDGNLVLLCSRDHRVAHTEGHSLEIREDGRVVARTPAGEELIGNKIFDEEIAV